MTTPITKTGTHSCTEPFSPMVGAAVGGVGDFVVGAAVVGAAVVGVPVVGDGVAMSLFHSFMLNVMVTVSPS